MKKSAEKIIDRLTDAAAPDFVAGDSNAPDSRSVINYFLGNLKIIMLVAVLSIIYISNRMVCEKQYASIDKLNKELTKAKYVSMITEAELLNLSRPDKIQDLLRQNELLLIEQEEPPYKVIFKEE